MTRNSLYLGDCRDILAQFPENSIESIVTDSPYGLAFMGKKWDYNVPKVETWQTCLRVLKPGGHLLAFAGTRTQHRMAVNIEDAGFEIRDSIAWVYSTGFPKSQNISKKMDKAAGKEREVIREENKKAFGYEDRPWKHKEGANINRITAPTTPEAKQWEGWGTALKPAMELITIARKPLSETTVVKNVLKWGTGGINIDACRVKGIPHHNYGRTCAGGVFTGKTDTPIITPENGRFPANFIHDGSEEVITNFPQTKSAKVKTPKPKYASQSHTGWLEGISNAYNQYDDSGSAARFFYCAKASKRERNAGCEHIGGKKKQGNRPGSIDATGKFPDHDHRPCSGNNHPTVKPLRLMRYLVLLVTPPDGVMLDPFMGSGTTCVAAKQVDRAYIGIEMNPEYFEIAQRRIHAGTGPELLLL